MNLEFCTSSLRLFLGKTWRIAGLWGCALLALILAGCARYQAQPLSPSSAAKRFDSRTLTDPGLESFIKQTPLYRQENWPPQLWELENLSVAAVYFNPELQLARAQWLVALGGDRAAAGRLNPTLNFTPGYDISSPSGAVPWLPGVTFDIPIETAGKRARRMDQSRRLSESARLNILVTSWRVRSALRAGLMDYSAALKRESILKRQSSAQQKIVDALQQQIAAGAASRSELSLLRVALDKLTVDLADAQLQSSDARNRVADAIGIPASSLEGVKIQYEPDLSSSLRLLSEWKELRDSALTNRADVLAALSDYEASQSALQLEIAKQYPDLHLGPGYQYDLGDHKFSLSISAELPILNQNQGGIAQAKAKRGEAAAKFDLAQSKGIMELDRALGSLKVSQQVMESLTRLAASRKAQIQTLKESIQAGAASRNDLLTAELDSASGELLELNAMVKVQQALGALEDALQKPIAALNPQLLQLLPGK